jgi:hypothetical protein
MSTWPEITPEQIVARLRMIVSEPESLCKTDLHYIEDAADEIERLRAKLVSKADELEKQYRWHHLATEAFAAEKEATIRELRKVEDERDEARRELCRRNRQPCPQDDEVIQLALRIYAEERGWDCFKEDTR